MKSSTTKVLTTAVTFTAQDDRWGIDPTEQPNFWDYSDERRMRIGNNKRKVGKEHKRTLRKIAKRSRQINRRKK